MSIIGLLASTSVFSLNNARIKARDARRLSDMRQISQAIELYLDQYGYYPICGDHAIYINGETDCLSLALIGAGLMAKVPVDPRYAGGGSEQDYQYEDCCGNDYFIRTLLEGEPLQQNRDYPDGVLCDSGIYPTADWRETAVYRGYGPGCSMTYQIANKDY